MNYVISLKSGNLGPASSSRCRDEWTNKKQAILNMHMKHVSNMRAHSRKKHSRESRTGLNPDSRDSRTVLIPGGLGGGAVYRACIQGLYTAAVYNPCVS